MKIQKILIISILPLLIIQIAAAQTCFTALNVPEANTLHWKTTTYTTLLNNQTTNYLERHQQTPTTPTLGSGQQYQIRIDQNCFNNYLLNHKDSTGATSNQINIEKRHQDLYTNTPINEQTYTISKMKTTTESTRTVRQINTGTIGSVNYLELPNTFNNLNNHPEVKELIDAGLCHQDLKITHQLDKIKYAVQDKITNTNAPTNCNAYNIIDCTLQQETGTNKEIATLNMALARLCKVPTRIAHGISQSEFDGINMYFQQDKTHYWIEYYDGTWYNKEVTPNTYTSTPRIEMCNDNQDNTNNGLTDCQDPQCNNDYACTQWPTTNNYRNTQSTNLENLNNAININNLTIGNEHATITWENQALNLRGINLDTAITITQDKIEIKHETLNKPATINTNRQIQRIYKNNQECQDCTITQQTITIPGTGTYTYSTTITNNRTTNNNTTTPPTQPEEPTLFKKYTEQAQNYYNKLTDTGKIVLFGTIALLIILYVRHRRNQRMYGYRP